MLHCTCDIWGVCLDDRRYVVKVDVSPAFDPEAISEEDLDTDHLEAIADLLAGEADEDPIDESTHQYRFDLCQNCRDNYCRDPLNKDMLRRLDFSEN